jgi:hypothetical protein
MAINIVWSLTNGGESISDNVDHGNISNGAATPASALYLRHDGLNNITDVGLYIRSYSGSYSGSTTATGDFNEILSWGGGVTENEFGGFEVNLDATNGFPTESWPTYDEKTKESGGLTAGFVHYTGHGDSEGNAVELSSLSGAVDEGQIQPGSSPNVRLKVRVAVPATEDTVGIRQWDQILKFNFTS